MLPGVHTRHGKLGRQLASERALYQRRRVLPLAVNCRDCQLRYSRCVFSSLREKNLSLPAVLHSVEMLYSVNVHLNGRSS